ncbi:MAG TPA: hypothetical protein VF177_07435 [Anaerolineae bacterium]
MRNEDYAQYGNGFLMRLSNQGLNVPKKTAVGIILIVALFAFEIFNFDTTQYALRNLLGDVRFIGLQWASILAIAFCSIDFAGLIRLFTPERGREESREVWYLMGAWLLGATMNAIMTWWAISLTLLNHEFGNEVLSREQLLRYVPVFVAVLVWLTRILFIGAFTVAGEHIFDISDTRQSVPASRPVRAKQPAGKPAPVRATPSAVTRAVPKRAQSSRSGAATSRVAAPVPEEAPNYLHERQPEVTRVQPKPNGGPAHGQRPQNSRVRQRPPRPNGVRRMPLDGIQAKSHDQH